MVRSGLSVKIFQTKSSFYLVFCTLKDTRHSWHMILSKYLEKCCQNFLNKLIAYDRVLNFSRIKYLINKNNLSHFVFHYFVRAPLFCTIFGSCDNKKTAPTLIIQYSYIFDLLWLDSLRSENLRDEVFRDLLFSGHGDS